MDLFTYLMAKNGHNTHKDLFSYLLGKNAGGSGTYTTFSGTSLNISNTIKAKLKNFMLNSTELTQDGTPTPDTPQDIHVITGNNNIKISDGTEEQNYPIDLGSLEYCKIGDYADQFIRTNGKNLAKPLRYGVYNASTGEYIYSTDYTCSSEPIAITSNEYIFSIDGIASGGYAYEFSSSNSYLRRGYIDNTGIYTPTSDASYFQYAFKDATVSNVPLNSNVQIEEGNTVTDYEPYGINEWYLKKNVGKKFFKDVVWTYYSASTCFYASISDIYIESSSNVMFKGFCNIYNKTTSDSLVAWTSKSDLQLGMRATTNNIIVKDSNYTDATTFKNARGNDYFYYVLSTPTYIHISQTDYPILRSQLENLYNNAKSYNGQTNITQTNEDLPFNISVDVKVS